MESRLLLEVNDSRMVISFTLCLECQIMKSWKIIENYEKTLSERHLKLLGIAIDILTNQCKLFSNTPTVICIATCVMMYSNIFCYFLVIFADFQVQILFDCPETTLIRLNESRLNCKLLLFVYHC